MTTSLPRWAVAITLLVIVGCTSQPVVDVTAISQAAPSAALSAAAPSAAAPATPVPAPSATPTATSRPTASPSPTPAGTYAPTSPAELHVYRTVVPMGFPFAAGVDYEYPPNFWVPRLGTPTAFNHVRRVLAGGRLQRAHDGVDIYVDAGTPVSAVFEGEIIDPASRWRPWDRERYGGTVVIVSDEPSSLGYAALYVHLDRIDVRPGDRVRRGEVLGTVGDSGNAAGTPFHLHFELRSPFLFTVREAGLLRRLDAFDPYPSLVAADPHSTED